jgi:mannosyltransferase
MINPTYSPKRSRNLILIVILFVAAILRFYHLRYQSFGLDELHTMNESDPGLRWSEMMEYLRCCDQHPPLSFIIERFLFTLFGSSERVARGFTALCGVLGVWAVYLLGKELLNKRLGLFAAALTCVNYFSIFYSQEARGYSLAFLLSALSYRYFIRLIRRLEKKDLWYYTLFTLLLMYTHYFGLFIAGSQFFIAFILLLAEKDRKRFIRSFIISGVAIGIGFAIWLPFVRQMSHIQSFWIQPINEDFFFGFFNEYFGNNDLLKPILSLALTFYMIRVMLYKQQKWTEIKNDPLLLSFALFTLSLVITYLVPYIRSVLVVPMLISRYTIVLLPLFLLAIAYGIELIPNNLVKGIIVGTFILLSLTDLLVVKKFYTTYRNTQFREVTQIMADNKNTSYPVLNERTGWQQDYYLRKFGYKGPIFAGSRSDMVDSILRKSSPRYDVQGFWTVNAFFLPGPGTVTDPAKQAALDTAYTLANEAYYHDAQVRLYLSKQRISKTLDTADFATGSTFELDKEKVIAVWGGIVRSNSFALRKGEYFVSVRAKGTPGETIYPHLVLYVNDQRIGDFYTDATYQNKGFSYTMNADSDTAHVSIELDNDYANATTHEDRNAFIQNILFIKQ